MEQIGPISVASKSITDSNQASPTPPRPLSPHHPLEPDAFDEGPGLATLVADLGYESKRKHGDHFDPMNEIVFDDMHHDSHHNSNHSTLNPNSTQTFNRPDLNEPLISPTRLKRASSGRSSHSGHPSSSAITELQKWTVQQVVQWLDSIELSQV